jgi:hypothetical protein
MRLILTCALAIVSLGSFAQTSTYLYPSTSLRWNEVICHIDGGVVRDGNGWRGEILYTVDRDRIYAGYSTSTFNLAYTLREGKLHIGDSHFTDAITYTLEQGVVYVGNSNFPLDIAYTIRPDVSQPDVINIFKENSISPFDIVATLQGDPSHTELFALLLSAGLL